VIVDLTEMIEQADIKKIWVDMVLVCDPVNA